MPAISIEAKTKILCGEDFENVLTFETYEEALKTRDKIDHLKQYWFVHNFGLNRYCLIGNTGLFGSELYITKLEVDQNASF